LLLNRFSDDPLVFRIIVPIELATVNVRATLEVRFSEHRNDAEKDLLDALDGAPPFRCLLVHQRVVARGVQNGDADVAIWVDWAGASANVAVAVSTMTTFIEGPKRLDEGLCRRA
jgi:hypothetical protein